MLVCTPGFLDSYLSALARVASARLLLAPAVDLRTLLSWPSLFRSLKACIIHRHVVIYVLVLFFLFFFSFLRSFLLFFFFPCSSRSVIFFSLLGCLLFQSERFPLDWSSPDLVALTAEATSRIFSVFVSSVRLYFLLLLLPRSSCPLAKAHLRNVVDFCQPIVWFVSFL